MNYNTTLKRFFGSQYLYGGVRMTISVLLPALILFHYNLLNTMMALPLGALCVSLTDLPGPLHHRRNSMLASIVINAIVVLVAGISRNHPWLIAIEIAFFGMFFSMMGVYGNRVSGIGLIGLLAFIFNIDGQLETHNIWKDVLWFSLGGGFYVLLTVLLTSLRPYKPVQQLLGECIMETADYLSIKAAFYLPQGNFSDGYVQLAKKQVQVQQLQADVREMLFKTRRFVTDTTHKGRVLMLMYLDAVDLFERIITSQQQYETLHKAFGNTNVLLTMHRSITVLANEIRAVGLAIQNNEAYLNTDAIEQATAQAVAAFANLRAQQLNTDNLEDFIRLRSVVFALEDVAERIKRLHKASSYDVTVSNKKAITAYQHHKFMVKGEINPRLFFDNLHLASGHFRHALRSTIALLIGYIFSLFFPFGHSYWILLTIATIMKPAYSTTRTRNVHRLIGTLLGAGISVVCLWLQPSNSVLFGVMLVAMLAAYSFMRIQYLIAITGLTIYVLLSFYFLNQAGVPLALTDRIVDTLVGSVIAALVAWKVLPHWEHQQMDSLVHASIVQNQQYFNTVATVFTGEALDIAQYRQARRGAFTALANLGDAFQRMLNEPKEQQQTLYYEIATACHLLTGYVASLAYYAEKSGAAHASNDFMPLIHKVDQAFVAAATVSEAQTDAYLTVNAAAEAVRERKLSEKVQHLLAERRKVLIAEGVTNDTQQGLIQQVSELKSIADQFELIYTLIVDVKKLLQQLQLAK